MHSMPWTKHGWGSLAELDALCKPVGSQFQHEASNPVEKGDLNLLLSVAKNEGSKPCSEGIAKFQD